MSRKILRLGKILGRRVFERSSRSLSLTRDGERLIGPARQMLEFNDETLRHFIEPPVAATLRLGVADDVIPHQLPRLLARFTRAYPGLQLELKTGMRCELLSALEAGGLHLAIAKRDGCGPARRAGKVRGSAAHEPPPTQASIMREKPQGSTACQTIKHIGIV